MTSSCVQGALSRVNERETDSTQLNVRTTAVTTSNVKGARRDVDIAETGCSLTVRGESAFKVGIVVT